VKWVLPPWYEIGEAGAAIVLGAVVSLRLWVLVDHGSRAAAELRRSLRLPGARNVLWVLAGLCVLFMAAEEVLDVGSDESLANLNVLAREAGRVLATSTLVHEAARRVTDITGIGLVTAIASAALCLTVLRHRREALTLVTGSLSAWVLSGLLKLAVAVPRPHSSTAGFPSGHVVGALVGAGLLAWCLGRFASPGGRRAMYAGAAAVALLTGAARIIVDAHWLSDVIGGLAAGTVWLNVVILVTSRSGREDAAPSS
jgi:membrane-associated phospholipid phosphatase